MPKYKGFELPVVSVKNAPEDLGQLLVQEKPGPEATMELILYLERQKAKAAAALDNAITDLKGHMSDLYKSTREDKRGRTETSAGMVTYAAPGEKEEIKDRDDLVDDLTDEQIRIAFDPSAKAVKALKTILRAEQFERHITRSPTGMRLTYRDKGGDFENW